MLVSRENQKAYKEAEERIIQFGEGNFLRAFVDWMVQEMNDKAGFNGNVVVVQPIKTGMVEKLTSQDCCYHLVLKGIKNGKPVKEVKLNSSISRGIDPYREYGQYIKLAEIPSMRFIISNTTEAGIEFDENDKFEMQPPTSFPAKLTQLLYHRYTHFNGDSTKGFIILPCELIENNALELKRFVLKYCYLWNLPDSFIEWIEKSNLFCNTLVDRIVPGFSKETAKELMDTSQIEDNLCVDAEQFYLWVIEGPQSIKDELPTDLAKLNVLYVNDVKPYRTRKVRLLNAPHTLMTPVAYLSGFEFVRETIENPVLGKFVRSSIADEIIPTLDLPAEELESFAAQVLDRFSNPFVNHALMSISLNSVSKFKSRLLPILLDYHKKFGKLPENIVFSLAALIAFYKGEFNHKTIKLQDDVEVLAFFSKEWNVYSGDKHQLESIVKNTLQNKSFWGKDLSQIDQLVPLTTDFLNQIILVGPLSTVENMHNVSSN